MIPTLNPKHLLQNLINHGDAYLARDHDGQMAGPLVGYPDTYTEDGEKKQYVGCIWFDIDKIVGYFRTEDFFARALIEEIFGNNLNPTMFLWFQNGRETITNVLSNELNLPKSSFKEDKDSNLILHPDTLYKGSKVILVIDVCRKFFYIDKMMDIVARHGAEVIAIVCMFNQSPSVNWRGVPILSALHMKEPVYRQDAFEIEELMKTYNIVWNPKEEASFLQKEMKKRNKQSKN